MIRYRDTERKECDEDCPDGRVKEEAVVCGRAF
jgi:hypothetical protein